ncbi:MAG: Ada metal-binding domain-containing protein [Bacillota bacterium]|nr:Ada metal-binding domain-containing protein [Bacillota bacterium]
MSHRWKRTLVFLLALALFVAAVAPILAAPSTTSSAKAEAKQEYWASAKSNKFHYPYCQWAKKISPANLIVFKSREEALKAGYIPCKVCKP